MRTSVVLGFLSHLALRVIGQSTSPVFEDKEFNVTQALLDQGIDAADLPSETVQTRRSSDARCAAAVSVPQPATNAEYQFTRHEFAT